MQRFGRTPPGKILKAALSVLQPRNLTVHEFRIPVALIHRTGAGPETFDEISQGHMEQLRRYTPVEPGHRVLEIGCGIGRDAIPLSRLFSPPGGYVGIDIDRATIRWRT